MRELSPGEAFSLVLAGVLLLGGIAGAVDDSQAGAPVRVRFEKPEAPVPVGQPASLTLVVESTPGGEAIEMGAAQLLLRLPGGIRLETPGWTPVPLPEEEKDDPAGPWALYEKTVTVPASSAPGVLAREPLSLAVLEEGTNWVVSARLQWASGAQQSAAYSTLFATRRGGQVEFHDIPRK